MSLSKYSSIKRSSCIHQNDGLKDFYDTLLREKLGFQNSIVNIDIYLEGRMNIKICMYSKYLEDQLSSG